MKRIDTWQARVVVTVIFLLFIALVLPYVSSLTSEVTGVTESPDTSFFYQSEKIFDMAETYGESGRDFYILIRWTFDVVWPIVYGSFLYVMIRWIQTSLRLNRLTLLPIAGVVFDFIENICATLIFWAYPIRLEWIAKIIPYITMIKWIAIGISFVALIVGIILIKFGKKNAKEQSN
ncbi:MAG: hypothetical protein K8R73_11760 [Clostridiales bacterium]|nr:hypothetical protein [Clostridiales bacterium]